MVHFFFDIKSHLGELPMEQWEGVRGSQVHSLTFLHVHGNIYLKEVQLPAPTHTTLDSVCC